MQCQKCQTSWYSSEAKLPPPLFHSPCLKLVLFATFTEESTMVAFSKLFDSNPILKCYEFFGHQPQCLAGKVAWITSVSGGIGAELAVQLATAGEWFTTKVLTD